MKGTIFFANRVKSLFKVFRKVNYEMVNGNNYTIQKQFNVTKDKIPPKLRSGIYEVRCQDGCDFKY